jgi:hypothetical protein
MSFKHTLFASENRSCREEFFSHPAIDVRAEYFPHLMRDGVVAFVQVAHILKVGERQQAD